MSFERVEEYVKFYQDVVDRDLCVDVTMEKFPYEPSAYATHDSGKVVKNNRVTSEDYWIKKDHKFYQPLKKTYENIYTKYKEDFPDFTVQHHTDFRISKYSTGGFMSKHIDLIHHSHGQQYGYPQVTVLLFLNSDYDGGQIWIANNLYQTTEGSAIVFPSNFMYPHEVLKIIKGTRYSATCWLM